MLHQMLVSYKYIAYEDEDDDVQIEEKEPIDENEFGEGIHRPPDEKPQYFNVKTDKEGEIFKVKWDRFKK